MCIPGTENTKNVRFIDMRLLAAVIEWDITKVKKCIANGANVNTKNYERATPLMLAAKQKNIDMVRLLILRGADAKARDRYNKTLEDYASHDTTMVNAINVAIRERSLRRIMRRAIKRENKNKN